MNKDVVRLAVDFSVRDAQLVEFKNLAQQMTANSGAEPGTIDYEWFVSADGKHFRLVETYTDATALEAHFMGPVIQHLSPKLAAVCSVDRFEIYGDPGPKVREMAGAFGAVTYHCWIGIER